MYMNLKPNRHDNNNDIIGVHHSWNPPPLLKGGRTFRKLSHLGGGGGVRNFFARKRDKPVKGGGCCRMGDCHFFITLSFSHIYCV